METRNSINKFFSSIGFKLIGEGDSQYLGDYYDIYTNGYLRFRLVSDRSIKSMDVSSDNKNWYDIALVEALLHNKRNLNYIMTIEECQDFLQKEFDDITELFDGRNYLTTKEKLERLGNERVNQMFPRMRK